MSFDDHRNAPPDRAVVAGRGRRRTATRPRTDALGRIVLRAVTTVIAALAAGGCASVAEDTESLAEEYARRESRQIDEETFRQARDRERLLGRRASNVVAAPPLDIDVARTAGWQFGRLAHPLNGEPTCAALSGTVESTPTEVALRLVVLANEAFLIADRRLAGDRLESSVRIDSGLPIGLDVAADGRVATLRIGSRPLFDRLRTGTFAVVDVALSGADVAVEGTVPLEALAPMLDELVRCTDAPARPESDER